jgi:hybrid cluster-associated redox disulfide protein
MPVSTPILHPDVLVSDVMRQWPQTIRVFVRRHLACPGCAIASFHTLAEVAAEYDIDVDDLLGELQVSVSQGGDGGEPD